MHGDLLPIKFRDLRAAELEGYVTEILTPLPGRALSPRAATWISPTCPADGGRFRVNVFRKDTGVGATFRAIPSEVPSLDKLGLPADRHQAVRLPPGHDPGHRLDRHRQVDHAGGDDRSPERRPASSTSSAWRTRSSSFIAARTARSSSASSEPTFRASPRACAPPCARTPTSSWSVSCAMPRPSRMAMTAAETGHLVLGTLHTTSAVKTIDRVIDALPVEEREQTKSFLVAEPARRRHPDAGARPPTRAAAGPSARS